MLRYSIAACAAPNLNHIYSYYYIDAMIRDALLCALIFIHRYDVYKAADTYCH